jgi:hypothetical protein
MGPISRAGGEYINLNYGARLVIPCLFGKRPGFIRMLCMRAPNRLARIRKQLSGSTGPLRFETWLERSHAAVNDEFGSRASAPHTGPPLPAQRTPMVVCRGPRPRSSGLRRPPGGGACRSPEAGSLRLPNLTNQATPPPQSGFRVFSK